MAPRVRLFLTAVFLVVANTEALVVCFQAGHKKVQKQKKFTKGLITFFIVLSLALPLLASTVVKADAVVEIRNWHDLHAVRDNLAGSYVPVSYTHLTLPTNREV